MRAILLGLIMTLGWGGSALAEERVLGKQDILSEIVGHEFQGISGTNQQVWVTVGDNGRFHGRVRNVQIRGTYTITDDGKWCRRINNAPESCLTVSERSGEYWFVEPDGDLSSRLRRQ